MPENKQYDLMSDKMKIFLDTANCDEIKALLPTGMVDGVTTNPSLIAKSGRDIKQTIAEICTLVDGPVSAEVTAIELSGMRDEAKVLSGFCLLYTSPSPRDLSTSRMPSSA